MKSAKNKVLLLQYAGSQVKNYIQTRLETHYLCQFQFFWRIKWGKKYLQISYMGFWTSNWEGTSPKFVSLAYRLALFHCHPCHQSFQYKKQKHSANIFLNSDLGEGSKAISYLFVGKVKRFFLPLLKTFNQTILTGGRDIPTRAWFFCSSLFVKSDHTFSYLQASKIEIEYFCTKRR